MPHGTAPWHGQVLPGAGTGAVGDACGPGMVSMVRAAPAAEPAKVLGLAPM